MSTTNLVRWSGLISMLAGILFVLAALIHPAGEDLAAYNSPNWVTAHLLGWVSVMLMQLGLVGLYARQLEKTAWIGLVGFVLAFIGTAFAGAIQFMVATIIPLVAVKAIAIFDQARTPPGFALPLFALGFGLGYCPFWYRHNARRRVALLVRSSAKHRGLVFHVRGSLTGSIAT